jgi:hypothetical protein
MPFDPICSLATVLAFEEQGQVTDRTMKIELNMSTDWHLTEAVARLRRQGIDAKKGKSTLNYPHVLVIAGVEGAQEGLVRGWVLEIDPNAERVIPPTS